MTAVYVETSAFLNRHLGQSRANEVREVAFSDLRLLGLDLRVVANAEALGFGYPHG